MNSGFEGFTEFKSSYAKPLGNLLYSRRQAMNQKTYIIKSGAE